MENLYPKHGLVSRTYSKKSLIMALIFGSKSKFFMTMSIPSQDEPLTNRPVYCMEDPKQAFVEYASSRTDEAGVCTLPSDTVKNPKLGTYPVLSARSYPTIDPQCSSHIHSSINAIIIHPKQPEESHDNEPDIGHEAKGSFGNINSNQHPQPDPLASIATEQVRKLNSMLESLGLVP
ncbi:hypothetical protein Tco_0456162 [Tanacetum coccineum]